MRRIDIVLALLFVVLVLGLIFLPDLVARWRAEKAPEPAPVEAPVPAEPAVTEPAPTRPVLGPEAELERVSGILMLHQACVNRFEGFDARSRETMEAWKRQHAQTLARRGAEPDFHIVLSSPGGEAADPAKADEEQLRLCERNLEAMRADLEGASEPATQVD